jgi:uncharacterized protein with GYD domain
MPKLPSNVYEEVESRDGKTYTGEALKELRKKDRQEKAKKQLEEADSFGGKASAIFKDIISAGRKVQGMKDEPDYGTATETRKRRVEEAKKELGMKSGGSVKSASARADGCAIRGKTRA